MEAPLSASRRPIDRAHRDWQGYGRRVADELAAEGNPATFAQRIGNP